MPRPTPFDLVFASTAETVFPRIRAALERGGHDAADRDAFLLVPEVVSLLHDLRPEEGLGEGMDQLVALVHHAYLLWDAGALTLPLSAERLASLLDSPVAEPPAPDDAPRAYYAQLQDRQVWARVVDDLPAEPIAQQLTAFLARRGLAGVSAEPIPATIEDSFMAYLGGAEETRPS
jgi:hypothetical protein